jgi:hypothetical protein
MKFRTVYDVVSGGGGFEHEIFSPDSMMLRRREKFDKKLRKI